MSVENHREATQKRRIPLLRKLRALRGRIIGVVFWAFCAVTSLFLYQLGGINEQTFAIAASASAELRVPEAARVVAIQVVPGQEVAAGDVLVELEIPGLAQEIAVAMAELDALKEEVDADEESRRIRTARDAEGAEARLLEAEVELKDALAEVAEIRLEYTRVSAPGLGLPVREVEAVTARLEAAEAAAEAREANVKGLERLARKARLRQKGDDPVVAARLEVLQLQVDALRARVATLVVRAPQAGVVSGELPIVGSWVLGGDLLMEVVARGTREAVAWVEVRQARELKPGSVVELQDAMGLVSGTVKLVGPAVDEVPAMLLTNPAQREWRIPVVLHVADRELVPGELLVAEF